MDLGNRARNLSHMNTMGVQFLVPIFSNKLSYAMHFCGLSPQFTRGTGFELVLLLMLQIWGYPMLKSAS